MARKFSSLYEKMPADARQRVEKRVHAESMALNGLRRARELTQVAVAERLGVDQGAVSKIEKRADMYVSTLRGYIEAVGGHLELRAVFPDATVDVLIADADA